MAAVLVIGTASAPALAQDTMKTTVTETVKEQMKDNMVDKAKSTAKGMMTDKMPGGGTVKVRNPNSAAPDAIKKDGNVIIHNDGSAAMTGTETIITETIVMEAPKPVAMPDADPIPSQAVTPVSAPVTSAIPTNCPAGTTGQADGTCMITGNYLG